MSRLFVTRYFLYPDSFLDWGWYPISKSAPFSHSSANVTNIAPASSFALKPVVCDIAIKSIHHCVTGEVFSGCPSWSPAPGVGWHRVHYSRVNQGQKGYPSTQHQRWRSAGQRLWRWASTTPALVLCTVFPGWVSILEFSATHMDLTLDQYWQRRPRINPDPEVFIPANTSHWTNGRSMLAAVCDAGPTLTQHCFNDSCLLSIDWEKDSSL